MGGFLAGVGLLLLGAFQTKTSADFVRSASFGVWAAIIGAQTAFWAVVAGPLWTDLMLAWRRARVGRSTTLALSGVLVLILIVLPIVSSAARISWPLWGHQMKVRGLTIAGGLLAGVPALSGISLLHQQLERRRIERAIGEEVRAAIEARKELLRYLSVAGGVIAAARRFRVADLTNITRPGVQVRILLERGKSATVRHEKLLPLEGDDALCARLTPLYQSIHEGDKRRLELTSNDRLRAELAQELLVHWRIQPVETVVRTGVEGADPLKASIARRVAVCMGT